jgi:hypothetical protein
MLIIDSNQKKQRQHISINVNMPDEMPSILVSDQLTGIFLKGP